MTQRRILCFGELLLRLGAPGRERLLQSPRFDVHVGGAEANVAVSLARLGHAAALAGTVSDDALGDAALGELRRHGVDTGAVRRAAGRMGLYFLSTGAGLRPSEVLYDRAGSAFATAPATGHDWPALLEGVDCLHLSGVTPALGQPAAEAAIAAARAGRAAGALVSFDGNFRPRLWAAWDGDPAAILQQLLAEADLAFADHRDIGVVLGENPAAAADDHETRIVAAAARAFAAFPRLQRIATTLRVQHSVDRHSLGALMVARGGGVERAPARQLEGIVDRIGAGDAFAAGVLHGLLTGMDDRGALRFGLAAACLKHAQPGDAHLASADEIAACAREERLDVRR
ncbi:sugar kinase [Luteimonas sp. RD2P54]|uniref:Sugar kinase n=1 Tax=Luteimonas endophytica TaxID=3042023 RepID=A0ABT6J758_9GAMM|nr:sugar kinase [Luteimonas endophytica]MDH5822425.1 sugar kinase [Luteimonas endophytica]